MSRIGILGGTGKEGRGLALRFASRGHRVVLGSRDPEKARRIARELEEKLGAPHFSGASNAEAAAEAEAVLSTLPYAGQVETAREVSSGLSAKLLVTATIRWPPGLDGKPSAAEELRDALGGAVRVAAAFQTVSAKVLENLDQAPEEDVLVFSDEEATREEAVALVSGTGFRGVPGGSLANARVAEALTGVLLTVNKAYGVKSAGIRITGLPRAER